MLTSWSDNKWANPHIAKGMTPNKITAHNAGWRSQFRFAVSVFWPGVCEFQRCDMKLQSVLLGWSNPDQVLRVAAGIPRKQASDG